MGPFRTERRLIRLNTSVSPRPPAGRAGGTLQPGRYIDYNWKQLTPLSNLYVEMLRRLGVSIDKFGDSTGGLPHLV